jgi:hypothetical protein
LRQGRVEGLPSLDFIETADILMYQTDYDAPAVDTTATKFRTLSTSSLAYQVTILVEMNGHTMSLSIASNRSPSDVEVQTQLMWSPNTVYHFQTEAYFPVPLITSETRANLMRNAEIEETPVTLILVNGRDQFTESGVVLRRNADKPSIIGAWTDVRTRWHELPRNQLTDESGYHVGDAHGAAITEVQPNLTIVITAIQTEANINNVRIGVAYEGIVRDHYSTCRGFEAGVDRHLSRTAILTRSKQEMAIKFAPWRGITEHVYDEEEEYDWLDQHEMESKTPWMDGKCVLFKLKPWTKEIAARSIAKQRPSPDGGRGPYDRPLPLKAAGGEANPSGTADSANATFQLSTRSSGSKVGTITVLHGQQSSQVKLKSRR